MASATDLPARLDRSALFAVLIVGLAINALASRIAQMLEGGLVPALSGLLGVSVLIWLAIAAIIGIAVQDNAAEPVNRRDIAVAAILVILALAPFTLAAAFGLLAAAFYLLRHSRRGTGARRIALIATALTAPLLWGYVAIALLGKEIVTAEAALIGLVSGLPVEGNVFTAVDGSMNFVVGGSCSSLANLSLVAVCGVTMAQWFDVQLSRPMWIAGAASIVAVILINLIRLSLLGYHPEDYYFLHEGFGVVLFGNITLLAMLALNGWGVSCAARRPH